MKLKTRWIACLVVGLMSLPNLSLSAWAADLTADYTWKPLKIGGGGWVVGMDYSKTGMMYCRTDVSGAYCWHGAWGNNSWSQVVTTSSMPTGYSSTGSYQGVDSIVASPSNVTSAYMAFEGQIFRTFNYGSTWTATNFGTLGITMAPNGVGRRCGERLAIDPANDNNAYFGPENDYLCRCSTLTGTWTRITAIPQGTADFGVTTIKFDPNSGTNGAYTKVVYVTVMNGGVWRSADAGTTWTNIALLTGGPGNSTGANHSAVGPDGTYYVCCGRDASATSGIWKYSPTSNSWTNISPSNNTIDYQGIAVDPNNADRIVVMQQGGTSWTSTNQGSSWTTQTWNRVSTNITWLGAQTWQWLSIGAIQFDPTTSGAGKLWFAEGFGMWNTTDLADTNITWAEQSSGIEETCGNQVICPPGGNPNTAMLDIGSFYHSNPDIYNAQRRLTTFQASWDLDWCPANPNFLVGVHHDAAESHVPIDSTGYSTNGGMTWTTFPAVTTGNVDSLSPTGKVQFGSIAVSATNSAHIVWAPSTSVLPYYTTNTGMTFVQSTWPSGYTSGFGGIYTAMKPLAADRVLGDTFYMYHPTAGLYKSVDGGANWARVGNSPANGCYNSTLKAVPGISGDLWFSSGFKAGGLYHSTNGGASWIVNGGVTKAYSVGFGIAKPGGSGYPTIFIAGIVSGVEGIFRSTDGGTTWDKVCTNMPLGIFDTIDAMDGDKTAFGKVYICNSYSGFTYGATSGP